ncbi:hypothetical protein RCL_jg19146.t1 [Rhizophagus clarus]|uniref:Uncharacterized protein n=1 Tax=Rhizophagus clarus TaxID=94130 RepID=A0A8H3LU38_9GLOM|nr:hypothetical protein RCL_jg19146.t1 [Rhizophagus clarus]
MSSLLREYFSGQYPILFLLPPACSFVCGFVKALLINISETIDLIEPYHNLENEKFTQTVKLQSGRVKFGLHS